MSRVKFKIWDKTNNRWLTSNCGEFLLTQEGNAVFHQNGDNPLEAIIAQIDHEVLMYTGLKDKNGTEIYEGDIIKYSHKAVGEIKREVRYKYGMYGIEGRHEGTQIPFANILGSEREVVGNIYENPELLEGN
ncbi:YopX family protein [Clostridium paraputrificum]|uniref:YopX family protein n=1 Tax=Clostridium paraputrificum TaxID=29363 RepID=UPI001897E50D|nr:YopX family protein [Clostridium paraputrificum]MDC0801559.1 YopX family protein [Clostridium paraputrificum]